MLDGNLVYVDVETNGLSHTRGSVIEVAAIRIEKGRVVETFNSIIDPMTDIPPFISRLTGITQSDIKGAPTFADIADDLYRIMDDALFVAHNVRFDYSFLKQEFLRTGRKFNPRLLCTVRLSKTLHPEQKSHKLEAIIARHGLLLKRRHRAYDDARAIMLFMNHLIKGLPVEQLDAALKQQLKTPSLPKGLPAEHIRNLPAGPGVYILEDELGNPLYIGKSLSVKKRVMSHFSSDHASESEFRLSQGVAGISAIETDGELQALLLESGLIKDRQPLYNKRLRRSQRLTLARRSLNTKGYITVSLDDTDRIDPAETDDILAVYTTRGRARDYLNRAVKDLLLCPKLMGLEKGPGNCFLHQLRKCQGACIGQEKPETYNARLMDYFDTKRITEWPYGSAVIIQEKPAQSDATNSLIIDKWCVLATIRHHPHLSPDVQLFDRNFELDTYKILRSYIRDKSHRLNIRPVSPREFKRLTLTPELGIMT